MAGQFRKLKFQLIFACGALLGISLFAGCLTTESWVARKRPLPDVPVVQIAATWENQVFVAPNIVRGGQPTPALGGRLYLFGPDVSNPLLCDGDIRVSLFAETPPETGGQPVKLESWSFTAKNMKSMERKDFVGWGYNLALPWSTYDPNIEHVKMLVAFTPTSGTPLYAWSRLKLQHQKRQFHRSRRGQRPGAPSPSSLPKQPDVRNPQNLPAQKPWTGPAPTPQGQSPRNTLPPRTAPTLPALPQITPPSRSVVPPTSGALSRMLPGLPRANSQPLPNGTQPTPTTGTDNGSDELRRIVVPRR